MNALTAFVIRHRRLVMLAWLIIAVAGFATLNQTTKRLSSEFKLPHTSSYVANSKITELYHGGGDNPPVVLAVTAPSGHPASPATVDRVLEAAAQSDRVVLTENVSDFARLAGHWAAGGRHHAGVVIALSSRFSRRRSGLLVLAGAVAALADEPLVDRIVFLQRG